MRWDRNGQKGRREKEGEVRERNFARMEREKRNGVEKGRGEKARGEGGGRKRGG